MEDINKKQSKMYEYSEEELKLIEKNKKQITRELKRYIDIFNLGFGFFGYHVVINKDNVNQLDFYDKNNNLVYSRKFEDICGIRVFDFGTRLSTNFIDNYDNEIRYFLNSNNYRHVFMLAAPNDKKYGYKIELEHNADSTDLTEITIGVTNGNDEYVKKELRISEGEIKVTLNNQSGPYGNHIDGASRMIWYTNSKCNVYPLFFMTESIYSEFKQISGDLHGFTIDRRCPEGSKISDSKFSNTALNITRHPRNKETIEYTLNEVDRQLPGIKELIINNFSIYNYVMDGEYQPDPEIDEMINKITYDKCDIKVKQRIKKNEN